MDRESRTPPCPCSSVWQERCRVSVGLCHLPRPLDEVYLVRGRRVKGGWGWHDACSSTNPTLHFPSPSTPTPRLHALAPDPPCVRRLFTHAPTPCLPVLFSLCVLGVVRQQGARCGCAADSPPLPYARTHTHTHQAGGPAAAAPSGAGTMPTPPLATRSTNGKATCTATPPADVIAAGALFTSTPPPALCLCPPPTPVLSPPFLRRRRRRTTSYGGRHSLSPSAQYNAHVLSPPRILLPVHPSPSTSLSAGPPHPPILRHRTH